MKTTPAVRAQALHALARACYPDRPAAAALLRRTADHVAAGVAVVGLAGQLANAGLDPASAMAACRLCR